jgi:hypothetical protein
VAEVQPVARTDLDHSPADTLEEPAAMLGLAGIFGAVADALVHPRGEWMSDVARFGHRITAPVLRS